LGAANVGVDSMDVVVATAVGKAVFVAESSGCSSEGAARTAAEALA
jgi:hypothetical protein